MDRVQAASPSGKLVGWFDRSRRFLAAVNDEVRKVTWPTRDELVKATRIILLLSILLGITIGVLDWLLQLILVNGVARLAR